MKKTQLNRNITLSNNRISSSYRILFFDEGIF